jgi:DNA-binding YbaB/EbfC family protein
MNKPFGEKAGLGELMKKAQEMQKKMQEIQQQVAAMKVKGTSGGGLVEITMNGRYMVEANGVKIDASVLKEDKSILEDLVAAAINDAVSKIEKGTRDKMSSLTGIKLPDGFDLPTE